MLELSEIATAHRQIKEYFQGDFLDAVSRDAAQYPLMVATLQPGGLGDGFVQVNIIITIADKYNLQEYRQINEIHSDCLSICNDIKITMQQYRWTEFSDINFTIATDPFIQRSQDMTAGWSMNVSLNVFDDGNWCDLPMDDYDFENGTPTFTGDCQPATVSNSDESFNVQIPSGDSYILDDVHIVVTDQSENVLSDSYYPAAQDEVIVVTVPPCADADYTLVNTADTLLESGSIPSGDTLEIVAPDGIVHIKHEADGTIANVSTPSGATTEYIIQNNDITVNGANGFIIHAEEPLDIRLKNQTGDTITPQSVTHNGNQDHVDITINTAAFTPLGATLMKTGQTTSYNALDDGDTERGRASSFLVLPSNNPFGNTNRFTNKNGTQGYSGGVAIDWSTFNGSTVLAYYFGDSTTRPWATQLAQYANSTINGLTGWRLFNIVEALNIMNFEFPGGYLYNYAPFNLTRRYMFVSTNQAGTGAISTETGGPNPFSSTNKNSSLWGIWVRVCTVNGTTIS